MPLGILFWVVWLMWAVFGFWRNSGPEGRWNLGGHAIECFLFFVVGWRVFGFVIQN